MTTLKRFSGTLFTGLALLAAGCANAELGKVNLQLYATIVSPTCVIEPDTKNIIVNLPDYPGEASFSLRLTCPFDRGVKYSLSGSTADAERTIFTNTSSNSPAQGVGITISDGTGIIATNTERDLGAVGSEGKTLDMTATYARTQEKLLAGNVQSVVGLTFIYP